MTEDIFPLASASRTSFSFSARIDDTSRSRASAMAERAEFFCSDVKRDIFDTAALASFNISRVVFDIFTVFLSAKQ